MHTVEVSRVNRRESQWRQRRPMMRRIILMLLCSVGLWGCGAAARYLGPTTQGYSFHASAVPSIIFLPSDVVSQQDFPTTAPLLARGRREREGRGWCPRDVPVRRVGVPGGDDVLGPAGGSLPGAGVHYAEHSQYHGLLSDCGARGQRHAGSVGCRVVSTHG